jgi:YfiH family protein
LIFDPVQRAIAVVHAGWRGTVQKIAEQTIQSMQQHFGSDPANLMAAIGPSIQSCCYEVGDDVYRAFSETNHPLHLIFSRNYNKLWLNLPLANQLQLTGAGVKPENISVAPYCTRCHSDLFYSSRSNRGITGRFVAGMMLW